MQGRVSTLCTCIRMGVKMQGRVRLPSVCIRLGVMKGEERFI